MARTRPLEAEPELRETTMPTHLEQTIKACSKALDEAKKLEKQFKAAKTAEEKEKIRKMAAGAKKIAEAFYNSIDAAKEKDRQELLGIFKLMGQ
jgi:hypothetical protein